MQFVVPQFIDVEDKIIGPITTRQFIMGVASALLIFLAYKLADLVLFVIEAILIFSFYVLVAFVKVNGRPFYYFVLNLIRSLKRPHARVWDKADTAFRAVPAKVKTEPAAAPSPARPKLAAGSLAQLSLLLDTGGRYRPEEILRKKQN
jgi:hypothetical protein